MILLALAVAVITALVITETRAERRTKTALRSSRRVGGLADLLVYDTLVRPDTIATKDDAYIACWRLGAADVGGLDDQSIINIANSTASAMSALPLSTTLQWYELRVRQDEYDRPQTYPNAVFRWLDDCRREALHAEPLFCSERVLALTWKCSTEQRNRMQSALQRGVDEAKSVEAQLLREFDRLCADIEAKFGPLHLERLGERMETDATTGTAHRRNDLLQFVSFCIDGSEAPLDAPQPGTPLDAWLSREWVGGYAPRIADQHVSCVRVVGYPEDQRTIPLMLAHISRLRMGHLFSVRFMPMSAGQARRYYRNRLYDWAATAGWNATFVDPDAAEMAESSRQGYGHAARGTLRFGWVTITIVLRDRRRERVDAATREVIAELEKVGLRADVPKIAALDTWLGTPPGMGYYDQRRAPMSAVNVAHLFPLHVDAEGTRYAGSPTLPPRTPATLYARTPGNGLYRIHLQAGKHDTFNGIVAGKPGGGKSTLLNILAWSARTRLPAAGITIIDHGKSGNLAALYRLTRWVGGDFHGLLGDGSPGFALFARAEEPEQARECLEIIVDMLELSGVRVDPHRRSFLTDAMRAITEWEPSQRNLSAFLEILQDPDGVMIPALRAYARGGVLGDLFEATRDSFEVSLWNVIDISSVIELREQFLVPVLRVIFWKMREGVRALRQRTGLSRLHWLYHVDEAHALLGHERGARFVKNLLKTGRAELSGLWLWSNSIADFARSPILEEILKASSTRIYTPDPGALETAEGMLELYRRMELPERGIQRLPTLEPWHYLFHQPEIDELREITLNLSPLERAIVGRSRPGDNELVDTLMARYPTTWRVELLRVEGINAPREQLDALVTAPERFSHPLAV